MPIKQFGTCSAKISFKQKQAICKFYVVEYSTAIIGITDSEQLDLVRVNFDAIEWESSLKVVYNVKSDSFKKQMENEFPELFKGISCMDSEISIKLHDGAIPHTEPIRGVPHAMQEPLKAESEKLYKEGILHKVDIREPMASFVCVK